MESLSPSGGVPAKAEALHVVSIEHHLPGRLRIKIPRAAGRQKLLESYVNVFADLQEVQNITSNAVTGCIVMHYRSDKAGEFLEGIGRACREQRLELRRPCQDDPDAVAKAAAEHAELLAQHSEFAKKTMTFFNDVDLELKMVSGNTIDLNIALVGSLAIFTFMGIGAAASTPMWVTLALYGINHAVRLQSEGLAVAPVVSHALPTP